MKCYKLQFLTLFLSLAMHSAFGQLYEINDGLINFFSDAKLEKIEAHSKKLKGLMDNATNQFAFSIEINSFEGFNSDLQREHFQENYLESDLFPKAAFSGKLIDKFNPSLESQTIRAKGNLEIHGIKKERIIEVLISKSGTGYKINTTFFVLLEDHGITIPRVVFQKIAPTVQVTVSGTLQAK